MKRKLSLLMAAIMALSTLPFTATEVQANTTNRIHGIPGTTVPADTVFVESQQGNSVRGWSSGAWQRSMTINALPGNVGSLDASYGAVGAAYAIHAGYLELELRSRQRAGDMFRFELDQGEWLFRSSAQAAQDLYRMWNWYSAGTPDTIFNTETGAPSASNVSTDQKAGHGSSIPGINTVLDLILMNRDEAVAYRNSVTATHPNQEGFNGTGYYVAFDGPLGQVSSGRVEEVGITGAGAKTPTAGTRNDDESFLPGNMPPVVRPSDWNFPHGYPNDYIVPPSGSNPRGEDGDANARWTPPSLVLNRIDEILNMPVSAFSTEGNVSQTSQRIGRGLTLNNEVIGRTYDIRRGFFLYGTRGTEGSYVRFANAARDTIGGRGTLRWTAEAGNEWTFNNGRGANGTSNSSISTVWGMIYDRSASGTSAGPANAGNVEVPYIMDISSVADGRTEATVTLLDDADAQDVVLVPLVIRVPSSEGATIRLLPAGHLPFVTQGTWHIAAAGPAQTAASIPDPVTSRDKFEIDSLIIRELRANSIRRLGSTNNWNLTNNVNSNAFDLVLTPGFYFDPSVLTNLVIFLERDLTWQTNLPGWGQIGVDYRVFFPEGHESSRDRLRIEMINFNQSQLIEGSMDIKGLVIWAEETVPFDIDVEISLENPTSVSPGTFWQTNQQLGGLFPANPPAGWSIRANSDVASEDWIRRRAGNSLDFDIIRINPTVTADVTAAQTNNFVRRGVLIGWVNNTNGTVSASDMNASQINALGAGATGVIFRERTFNVTNPSLGLVANNFNDQAMVTPQTIRAGTRRDWGIVLRTEGTVPELISGRYEGPTSVPVDQHHKTARVVFEEIVPNSWWAGRQVVLSLPEEVKWRRVWFEETRYPPGSPAGNETIAANTIQRRNYYVNIEVPPTGQSLVDNSTAISQTMVAVGGSATTARNGVHFDENKMYWTDVLAWRGPLSGGNSLTQNRGAYIRFDSWVSIAAPFEGDIILSASGSAVPTDVYTTMPSAIIATAIPPVRVAIEQITDLRIGLQYQPTVDIVLTESRAGALMRDKNVRLSVTDLIATDILFGPGVNVEVTQSNGLTIRNIGTGLAGTLYGGSANVTPTLGIEANRGTISFDIASVSHQAPAVITISNVSVRVDRTVPETNSVPYWVIVWGNAIANNFGQFDTRPVGQSSQNWPMWERTNMDRFLNHPGIFADYIRVVTGGSGSPWLSQEVRVTIGELWYSVNGQQFDMDVAALLDPATSSTFVPLRFIANAFGLRDEQIVWDNHNRTATIVLPDSRVVQFAADSPIMMDNGIPRNITNANEESITPMIVPVDENDGGRMFLPFRFFGEVVLQVPVAWEADTQTAVFNPGAAVARH